jgi:hypothetical protein
MTSRYVRRGSIPQRNSIPHTLRTGVNPHQLMRYTNFDETAIKWATEDVEPELKTFMLPLANPNDTIGAANAINQLSIALTPHKENPNAGLQARVNQQLQSAIQTPASPPPSSTIQRSDDDEDEQGRTVSRLSKLHAVEKIRGQIMAHMSKILEAQSLEFQANAKVFGQSSTTLKPSIDSVDLVAFRKEMLRIFQVTYDPADRIQDLHTRINEIEYRRGAELIEYISDLDKLITDITSVPDQREAMFRVLNRNIWMKLNHCHVDKFKAIAANIDIATMNLEQTRTRLINMHRDIGEGGYKTIRTHKAVTSQPTTDAFCEACKHNFDKSYPHSLQTCKANPNRDCEDHRDWFRYMWNKCNGAASTKTPYIFDQQTMQVNQQKASPPPLKKQRSF